MYFCFTNYVYASAIGSLTILILPFFATKERNFVLQKTARRILISLSTFLILCIFSVLITHPALLLSFDFYRRDGNVFITYLSLIVLICSAVDFDIRTIIKRFVYISTIANLVSLGMHFLTNPSGEYMMFFTAHNAAGGFLGMLCIANFVFICRSKAKGIPVICLLVNLFGLYMTNSRGSLFPLIGAFLFLFMAKKTIFKNFDVTFNVFFFLVMFFFVASITAVRGADILVHINSFTMPSSDVVIKVGFELINPKTGVSRPAIALLFGLMLSGFAYYSLVKKEQKSTL